MHFENTNLPADVHEVFFSDVYFYASSRARNAHGRPTAVGCGGTREAAVADMRKEVRNAARRPRGETVPAAPAPLSTSVGDQVVLSSQQRQALARNIRRLRMSMGVAQLDVARDALGFEKSHAVVSRLERGTSSCATRARSWTGLPRSSRRRFRPYS